MTAQPPQAGGSAGQAIVFCATQRTGSTMMFDDLCRLMGEPCGIAEDLYIRIIQQRSTLPWPDLWAAISAANQVAGYACVKVMFHYTPHIAAFMADRPPPAKGRCLAFNPALFDSFAAFFRDAIWVHVVRRDVCAQAVSMYFAETSRQWHAYAHDPPRPADAIPYDLGRLRKYLEDFATERAQWPNFFRHYGIDPVRLEYEDASEHYPDYIAPLLARAGLQMRTARVMRRMLKLGSDVQARYATRLRADLAPGRDADWPGLV